jgi:hypothetical protein
MTEEFIHKKRDKTSIHYVSNLELLAAYKEWYAEIEEAEAAFKEPPPIPRYIADCMMRITSRLSYAPNFINYSYREEMVGDALENVIRTARRFDPVKSQNPFSFLTTIAFRAFLRRIATEKKQTYIKGKIIEDLPMDELLDVSEHDTENYNQHQIFLEFLRDNSYIVGTKMPKRKKKAAISKDVAIEDVEILLDNFLSAVNEDIIE